MASCVMSVGGTAHHLLMHSDLHFFRGNLYFVKLALFKCTTAIQCVPSPSYRYDQKETNKLVCAL